MPRSDANDGSRAGGHRDQHVGIDALESVDGQVAHALVFHGLGTVHARSDVVAQGRERREQRHHRRTAADPCGVRQTGVVADTAIWGNEQNAERHQ